MNHENKPAGQTSKAEGRQGVDKVPAQDAPIGNTDKVVETQKGKTKVDGDPSTPDDRSAEEQ